MESGLRNLRVARWFSAGEWKVIFKRVSTSAKSRAQFFRVKIAVGSRQVQRGQGAEDRDWGQHRRARRSWGSFGYPFVFVIGRGFTRTLTTKCTKDTKKTSRPTRVSLCSWGSWFHRFRNLDMGKASRRLIIRLGCVCIEMVFPFLRNTFS